MSTTRPSPLALLSPRNSRQETFARVKRSMVAIAAGFPERKTEIGPTKTPPAALFQILGSGFLVDPLGIVATAGHVLDAFNAYRTTCVTAGKPSPDLLCVPEQVGVIDVDGDFAVRMRSLYVKRTMRAGTVDVGIIDLGSFPSDLAGEVVRFADYPCMEGDEVGCCGYPLGLELHRNSTVNGSFSTGIVSAILPASNAPQEVRQLLQLDAFAVGGSSGGPVFRLNDGATVGILIRNLRDEIPLTVEPRGRVVQVPLGLAWALDVSVLEEALRIALKTFREADEMATKGMRHPDFEET